MVILALRITTTMRWTCSDHARNLTAQAVRETKPAFPPDHIGTRELSVFDLPVLSIVGHKEVAFCEGFRAG